MSKLNSVIMNYPAVNEQRIVKSNRELMELIGVRYTESGVNPVSLPFSPADTTDGSESELQTVVEGSRKDVDLPLSIEQSNYFANTMRRTIAGEMPKKKIHELEKYLQDNRNGVWENSWVRLPLRSMSIFANEIFQQDLCADKENPAMGLRSDRGKFIVQKNGEEFIRVPISYLLKLALAEAISSTALPDSLVRKMGMQLMDCFLNDNTSPETSSFYVISGQSENNVGKGVAREMSGRFLLTQLLIMYANKKFQLEENGQKARVFFSPHPPLRQKKLSNCISDSFYRDLFMNPCLSGWCKGEEKYEYMHLCHRVLSRSQFNAVIKLREAGIITNNLVSLPNLCNISLANNGTHVSMGSRKITRLLKESSSGFNRYDEKYLGDMVVKIVEHFLPLFVGTFTAAPYRLDFSDFHPEKALGFLPHELDFTHLRMLWRRWRKKARIKIMGNPITPFGPPALDRALSRLFDLRGDYVCDFRLLDYLVAILSTEKSPSLNSEFGNQLRLKQDLSDMGVFETKMSLYLFEKMREFEVMGFSGFEARHYSLFDSFSEDVANAVGLQNLLYLLAFKYIASGKFDQISIPDDPFTESERRQAIFVSAIGIPTFFIHQETKNSFLRHVISGLPRVRSSRRYPGYLRIYNDEYRLALLRTIREDAADLIEMTDMKDTLDELEYRLKEPQIYAASGKLLQGILNGSGQHSPFELSAEEFNAQAEKYYRTGLLKKHTEESFDLLSHDIMRLEMQGSTMRGQIRSLLYGMLKEESLPRFFAKARLEVMAEEASIATLEKMIMLILVQTYYKSEVNRKMQMTEKTEKVVVNASVY